MVTNIHFCLINSCWKFKKIFINCHRKYIKISFPLLTNGKLCDIINI